MSTGGAGGGGGSADGSGIAGGGVVSGTGELAQAASCNNSRAPSIRIALITESYSQDVDLCRAQATAQQVEVIEIIGRSNIDAVVVAVVDFDALYM